MTGRTTLHEPETLALRGDCRQLVRDAGGNEAAASFSRRVKRHQAMSDYGLPNGDSFMPVDVVRDLERATRNIPGWPRVTRALASAQGCALVVLPEGEPGEGSWHQAIAALTTEFAEVSSGLSLALADGKVTADEVSARDLVRQTEELIAVAVNLKALFERVMEAGR